MVAPAITAPAGSAIVPVIVPWFDCANAAAPVKIQYAAADVVSLNDILEPLFSRKVPGWVVKDPARPAVALTSTARKNENWGEQYQWEGRVSRGGRRKTWDLSAVPVQTRPRWLPEPSQTA